MVEKLVYILNNRHALAPIRQEAIRFVNEECPWEKIVEKTLEIYTNVMESKDR